MQKNHDIFSISNIIYTRGPVYLYELPSSIGSSPHPCHWTKMLSLYGDKFGEVSISLSHCWENELK